MRELNELKTEMSKTFKPWMDERDIKELLDREWTSRESWYVGKDGYGTQDFDQAELKKDRYRATGLEYFDLKIDGKDIRIYIHAIHYDWDDEDKMYLSSTAEIVGWDYA